MAVDSRLESGRLRPDKELAQFLASLDGEGAVVSFIGVARAADREGGEVTGLFLDHHTGLTAGSLQEIGASAIDRFEASRVRIVHRCGEVEAGAPIVFVAAAAIHRRAAFEAADYLMDHLKTDAVFWKREDGPAGSKWIEPTEADHADRGRWSE